MKRTNFTFRDENNREGIEISQQLKDEKTSGVFTDASANIYGVEICLT